MAIGYGDQDYFDEVFDQTPPSGHSASKKPRKSTKGRSLMRWDVDKDQYLLLMIEHVCNRDGVVLPWDDIGAMLEPKISAEAIKQHLAKLTKHRLEVSMDVPPPLDKTTRKRAKPSAKNTTSAGPNVNTKEEEQKRSSLLPPPKPARRSGQGSQRGQKRAQKTAAVHLDPAYSPDSAQNYDHSAATSRYQSETPVQTYLTADQQLMVELNAARAGIARLQSQMPPDEPLMSGVRNDVFLGIGNVTSTAIVPSENSQMQLMAPEAWPDQYMMMQGSNNHTPAFEQPSAFDHSHLSSDDSNHDSVMPYTGAYYTQPAKHLSGTGEAALDNRPLKRARKSIDTNSSTNNTVPALNTDTLRPAAAPMVDFQHSAVEMAEHDCSSNALFISMADHTGASTFDQHLAGQHHIMPSPDATSAWLLNGDFSPHEANDNLPLGYDSFQAMPRSQAGQLAIGSGTESQTSVSPSDVAHNSDQLMLPSTSLSPNHEYNSLPSFPPMHNSCDLHAGEGFDGVFEEDMFMNDQAFVDGVFVQNDTY